jgi:hypothetical protein
VNEPIPPFFARLSLAFKYFVRILSDGDFAARAMPLLSSEQPTNPSARPAPQAAPAFKEAQPEAALQLLGLLQQEGRFVDFLEEDVTGFSDTDVGAAARVVHQGCRKAISDHFKIVPIRAEQEGSRITLPEGFDASSVRVTGNVVGKPPYSGSLVHRGWRVTDVTLPKVAEAHDIRVVAPAEVEL